MGKFADAFKKARLASGKKFREIKNFTGLSIGYLSDIENSRRNPPELSIVEKIEELFGITDNHLVRLAKKERMSISNGNGIGYLIQARPELQELLLRADALPEEDLEEIINRVRILTENSDDSDGMRLFLDKDNANFYDWRNYSNQ